MRRAEKYTSDNWETGMGWLAVRVLVCSTCMTKPHQFFRQKLMMSTKSHPCENDVHKPDLMKGVTKT